MSDKPKFDAVALVAVERAFYQGALINPGTPLTFTGDKLPKWAALPADAPAKLKPKPVMADTKPKAAQAAVKAKAAGASITE